MPQPQLKEQTPQAYPSSSVIANGTPPAAEAPKQPALPSTVPAEVKKHGAALTPGVTNVADVLWGLIIRPPRSKYQASQLGPNHFRVGRHTFVRRTDATLRNPRGLLLKGSFFEPLPAAAWEASRRAEKADVGEAGNGEQPKSTQGRDFRRRGTESRLSGGEDILQPLPCVIFLHGNSSCRLEALSLLPLLMPLCISLFCFDFSGCGLSEGEYISLGWFERDDLATCIEYLRSLGRVSRIGLWGRSMGAFSALLHADRDPSIAGLVLDSPFTSLNKLAEELAHSYAKVPSWMVRAVLVLVRSVIQSKADFDIDKLTALEHVEQSFSPAMFIAATGDDFIQPHHAQELHQAWPGEKDFAMVSGDHNSVRDQACMQRATLFLCRAFYDSRLDKLLENHASGLYDIFAGPPVFPTALDLQNSANDNVMGCRNLGGEEEASLCRQMRLFPALRMMRLMYQRRARRPVQAHVQIRLQQDDSEAGFFLRVEPVLDELATERGVPRYIVVSVSTEALIVSRICDDALETLAAGAGLGVRETSRLRMELTVGGSLHIQLGENPALEIFLNGLLREELTLWIMLLRGLTQFGPLTIEDGEATLRERLGGLLLDQKHLGPPGGGTRAFRTCAPAPLPRGDTTTTPGTLSARRPEMAAAAATVSTGDCLLSNHQVAAPLDDRVVTTNDFAFHPEDLIGWRVNVHAIGEGVIVGVKRRWGRSTLHIVSCSRQPAANLQQPVEHVGAAAVAAAPTTVVMLCRKDKHRRRRRGRAFELLKKEF